MSAATTTLVSREASSLHAFVPSLSARSSVDTLRATQTERHIAVASPTRPILEWQDSTASTLSTTSIATSGLESSAVTLIGQPGTIRVPHPSGLSWQEFRSRLLNKFNFATWSWLWIAPSAINRRQVDKMLTPLHWAAAAGDLAALKVFLGKERSLLQKLSPKADQQLALHVAAAFGRKEIVKYLLDNNVVKEEEDQKERTALYIAVMQDNTAIAKMLLQNGANPNISPKYMPTTLDRAINNANEDIVEMLLERGASVSIFDNSGNYPIHLAAKAASPRVMSMLVDYKAALELPQIGHQQTALHLAAESHNVHVLRTLITKGASVSCVGGWEKKTALHSVVRDRVTADLAADKKYAAAEALILAGAPLNATDKFSRTPLHYAVAISPSQDEHDASADSTAEVVELLAQHGANMNAEATSTTGGNIPLRRAKWTPLHEAALCGDPAVIRKLVLRGAAIDAHDGEGETPLNAAAMRLFAKNKREERDWHAKVALQVIQALLDCGADATKAAGWSAGKGSGGMSTIEVAQGLKEQAKKAKQVARKKNDVYFRPKAAARHMEIAATMNGT